MEICASHAARTGAVDRYGLADNAAKAQAEQLQSFASRFHVPV
jgi:hypothetical protein